MKGFSLMIAFGKPCRPKIDFYPRSMRLICGPIAIHISFLDLDALFAALSHQIKTEGESK